jgi:methylated-DNA-[protein]-cysteine S-methyltransferase
METQRYALIQTDWGVAGIVCSTQGVCGFIWPQASADKAQRAVQRRAPGARRAGANRLPRDLARKVTEYFAGRAVEFSDVPLDLSGQPPFRARVLGELRRVGYGRTVSYGQLARRAGNPRGARAVGQAMANNPLPVIVPCHRVLRGDGGVGGFSAAGGTRLKRRLLEMEQRASG